MFWNVTLFSTTKRLDHKNKDVFPNPCFSFSLHSSEIITGKIHFPLSITVFPVLWVLSWEKIYMTFCSWFVVLFLKGVFVWVWEFWFLDLVIRTKRIADTRTYLFSLRILWIIRDICIMCCCWNLLLAFRSRSWTCTTSPMMKMILVCLLSALSFYPLIFVFPLKYWFLLLRP